MIPADLLDQLRETDEELFLKVIGGFPLKNGKYLSMLDMKPPAAHAWLQHCLQEAIRWRGYSHELKYLATSQTAIADIYFENSTWSAEGTTEAEALLRAYLAAIQEAA